MFCNSAMKNLLNEFSANDSVLPDELQDILNEGFKKCNHELIFFNKTFNEQLISDHQENFSIEKILERYIDKSGFENFINKIHIDDYIAGRANIIKFAFIFLDKFNILWKNCFPQTGCISVVSFDLDNELGLGCVFRFHVKRAGEEIYDLNELNKFIDPIAVEIYSVI